MAFPITLLGVSRAPDGPRCRCHDGGGPEMYRWTITDEGRVVLRGIAHFPFRGEFRVLHSALPERPAEAFNRIIQRHHIPWRAVDGHPEYLAGGDQKYEMHVVPY